MEIAANGMVVLTGKAPTVPGLAAPKDKTVSICADFIAMVERAMLDPSKVQQGPNGSKSSPARVTPFPVQPIEVTIVHLRNGASLVVEELPAQVLWLRDKALTSGGTWSRENLMPSEAA